MRAGLVGGEGFAIDASVIEADASAGRKVDGKLTAWPETEKFTRTASVSHQRPSTGTSLLHEPQIPRTCECISKILTRVLLVTCIMIWDVDAVRGQRSPNGWRCTIDDSVGYVYNIEQKAWKPATFDPGANFIVRPPREEDIKIFPEALGQAYVVFLQNNE